MSKRKRTVPPKTIHAAGGVIWRDAPDGREVLVVHRPRYDDWSLPKGKRHDGEAGPATAIREIAEETGYRVRLGPELRPVGYLVDKVPKQVRYWLGQTVGEAAFEPNDEVDEIAWWDVGRAERQLHPNDRGLVRGARRAKVDVPLVIVRHALSVPRKKWKRDDHERPLSAEGVAQAAALPALLDAWAPTRIVTSTSLRCSQTVEPLGVRTGLQLELEEALSEESFEAEPKRARSLIKSLRASGEPVVVCTHRPLLATVARLIGLQLPGQARANPLPKAACWVAHTDGNGRIERHTC